ncbi:hypothetical protein TWF481_003079 [Arthrobotrys musiformis]|uniref:Cleavage and polyadenylation specificity factor subunit 2 n=1 Tax=Arthrobotrys musiformis TaxID=47236 RepID=A0AAV9VS82_9PEZI
MFQFIPLLGAQSTSRASASLLLLDNDIKILVDCGWAEPFNVDDLAQIEKHAPTISLILLTHPTLSHIGAYAHCCSHIPLFSRIPVYCTYPVANLGRSLLQDAYLSTPLITSTYPPTSDLSPLVLRTPPSSDDIDRYFDAFNSLKYSQPYTFPSPPLAGLTITAYRAGHTLGGTIWRIQHSHSSENILYAISWNHLRDAHLSSASFLPGPTGVSEEFLNPTALVCSPHNCLPGQISTPRKKRDELLLSAVRKAAFAGGTVLIPTDSSARILELAYLLEHDFRSKASNWNSSGASISLAVRTAGRTFRYVRALLEWMDESMVKEFESVTHNNNPSSRRKPKTSGAGAQGDKEDDKLYGPFDFRHLKLIEHKHQLAKLLQKKGGKVVITSDKSLEWGFSTEVVKSIASEERNLIVLTERGSEGTAGGYLYKKWREICLSSSKKEEVGDANIMGQVVKLDSVMLDMNLGIKIPLNDPELAAHNEFLKQQQLNHDIKDAEISLLETAETIAANEDDDDIAGVSSSSDEEDEDEDPTLQGKSLSTGKKLQARKAAGGGGLVVDEGINVLMKGKGIHDWDVRHAKGRNRMFPFSVQRRKFDDYGEVVRVEDFVRVEEDGTAAGNNPVKGEKIEFLGGRGGGVVLAGGDEEGGIGRKRKWDKVSTATTKRGNGNTHSSKKLKQGRRGRERSASVESEEGAILTDTEESDEYEPEDVVNNNATGVCKLVINTTTVMLKNGLVFVDYEGISDGRSLRMLLPQLKPKKVVLVGGTVEETEVLGKEVEAMMEKEREKLRGFNDDDREDEEEREKEVFTPKVGEIVNVGGETEVWSLKLSDSLVKMLKWQSVGGLGVVHVIGRVVVDESTDIIKPEIKKDEDVNMETPDKEEEDKKRQLILDVLPPTSSTANIKSAKPIHVGDIKLPELRKVLLDAGHTAELTGEGRLLCDGVVSVVKEGVGRVTIEDVGGSGGLLSGRGKGRGRFWEVRKWVYEGLARVSGN